MRLAMLLSSVVIAMIAGVTTRTAAAEECEGPFKACAKAVVGQCSRDPDGVQRITYWDFSGKTTQFEQCVGRIYEGRGLPNPYKTGDTSSEELPFPRSEILFPDYNN